MISYQEANSIIEKEFRKLQLETEEVDLLNSTSRILAENIYSDIDLPPFTNSAMDGYTIHYNPNVKKWKIIGEVRAGDFRNYEIGDDCAVSVMTGGRLPDKADTVIPIEEVVIADAYIILKENASLKKGIYVRQKGDDLPRGEIAVKKNTLLKPRHVSVAASCGKSKLKVYKKLAVGVLVTGDELIELSDPMGDDKIRASNLYSLLSAVDELNQTGANYGIVSDNKEEIANKLKMFLNSNMDILIISGGVSVGKYDFVKMVIEELGIKVNFWKVNIKPGMPAIFGTYEKGKKIKFIFGLPGNPVSCLVNFIIFIKNNVHTLFGVNENNLITAELTEKIKKRDGKRHFLRGYYTKSSDGNVYVKSVGSQSSGNLVGMGKSNCLIVFDENKKEIKSGERVNCILI